MENMQSESINELFSALATAQGQMKPAIKDSDNPYFKSKYSDLASVWEAIREPLSKNGLCVSQSIMSQAGTSVLVTILGHKSGQWIKSVAPIISAKPDAQSYGSAVSYQRRYALSAICGVSSDDDDAEAAQGRQLAQKKAEPEKPEETLTFAQVLELENMIGDDTELLARILQAYGAKQGLVEIARKHFDVIKRGVERKMQK